eukprot:TRINITY_DN2956_c0_g3_i1.p1 TRINITY_DN2956_c0_g3~~TRINITY_DN2956_c0_g3_i1.p1  ORF type:complete len:1621 (+),score=302.44 TRINITY_DN2956_c0_g3_i1:34-4896(+)
MGTRAATRKRNLWVHEPHFSKEDLVINPDAFPGAKIGDIIEIVSLPPEGEAASSNSAIGGSATSQNTGSGHVLNASMSPAPSSVMPSSVGAKRLCLAIKTLTAQKGALQVSISQYIASVFDFVARRDVYAHIIPPEKAAVDFVEVSFKDQYIGRSDMWRLKLNMQNTCVYLLQKLSFACIRAQVEAIIGKGEPVSSGLITENTKFVFRSRSARFIVFVQLSREMWEFAEDGELYFEKLIQGFMRNLLERWKLLNANHSLTVLFFSRSYYNSHDAAPEDAQQDSSGRRFRDFYRVVVHDDTRPDWPSLLVLLKKEFSQYHKHIRWEAPHTKWAHTPMDPNEDQQEHTDTDTPFTDAVNSIASQGNFLEAVNLGMNIFDDSYIDRDLSRTGQMIVIATAGTGMFEVEAGLTHVTKQRMIDNGIGCEVVCLGTQPLHTVPLFKYKMRPSHPSTPTPMIQAIVETSADLPEAMRLKKDPSTPSFAPPFLSPISASDLPRDQGKVSPSAGMPPYMHHRPSVDQGDFSDKATGGIYNIPYWLAISFCGSARPKSEGFEDGPDPAARMFVPQCRLLDLNFNTTTHAKKQEFVLPKEPLPPNPTVPSLPESRHMRRVSGSFTQDPPSSIRRQYTPSFFSAFDDAVFGPIRRSSHSHLGGSGHARSRSLSSSVGRSAPIEDYMDTSGHEDTSFMAESETEFAEDNDAGSVASEEEYFMRGVPTPRPRAGSVSGEPDLHGRSASFSEEHALDRTKLQIGRQRNQSKHSPFPAMAPPLPQPQVQALRNQHMQHISSNRRRWSHLWFSPNTYIFGRTLKAATNAVAVGNPSIPSHTTSLTPNWKSLCEPASLPITTDFFPSQTELNSKYEEYGHVLTLPIGENMYQNNLRLLLMELISQRLAQGYQLITVSSERHTATHTSPTTQPAPPALATYTSLPSSPSTQLAVTSPASTAHKTTYYLSLGRYFHILICDPQGQNIQVKRYHRKNVVEERKSVHLTYKYHLWGPPHAQFVPTSAEFAYYHAGLYNWNFLDQLICGYYNGLLETLKYWRVQFTLIPQPKPLNTTPLTPLHTAATSNPTPPSHTTHGAPLAGQTSPDMVAWLESSPTSAADIVPSTTTTPRDTEGASATPADTPTKDEGSQRNLVTQPHAEHTSPPSTIGTTSPLPLTLPPTAPATPTMHPSHTNNLASSSALRHSGIMSRPTTPLPSPSLSNSPILSTRRLGALSEDSSSFLSTNNLFPQTETIMSDEERVTAFTKFKDFVNSLIAKSVTSSSSNVPAPAVYNFNRDNVNNTNMDVKVLVDPADPGPSVGAASELIAPTDLDAIYTALTESVVVKERKRSLRSYKQCFVGSEAVDVVMKRAKVQSRSEAVAIMQSLLQKGRVRHVGDKPQFSDSSSLYRFVDSASSDDQKQLLQAPPEKSTIVRLKNIATIEMDRSKTDRCEWMLLRYDREFSASSCFHLEFRWMVATGCVVEEFIQVCVRKAKQLGLTLVQTPTNRKILRPFLAPVHIYLNPLLLESSGSNLGGLGIALLEQYGFVPDTEFEQGLEYIHRTGSVFVRVLEDGFLWYLNHTPSCRSLLSVGETLFQQFSDACASLNNNVAFIDANAGQLDELDSSSLVPYLNNIAQQNST